MTRLLKTASVGLVLVVTAALLAGCDDPVKKTPAEFVTLAKEHIAKRDFRAGAIELKNALQIEPDNAEARYLLGTTYLELLNVNGARKELTRASDLGFDEDSLTVPMAEVMLLSGEIDRLLEETRVKSEMPADMRADIHTVRGRARLALQQGDEAMAEFDEALAAQPEHVGATVGAGQVAVSRRDLETATKRLEAARALDDNALPVHLLDADIGSSQGDFERAEAAFKKALEVKPGLPSAQLGLAWSQLQSGKPDDAIETLKPLLKASPTHPTTNFFAALAKYQKQQHQEAKDHAETTLQANGSHLPSRLIAGTSSYSLGAYEQARRHLQVVVSESPDHQYARKVLAATLLALGRADEASEMLESVTLESENDSQLLSAIGRQVLGQRDYASSRDYFERAVALRPDDAGARTQLAAAKLGLGENSEAVEELKRAIELDPESQQAGILLIMTYLREGRNDDALDEALRFQEQFPTNPHGFTLGGMARAGKGEVQAAINSFRHALELSPGDFNATNNLAMIYIAGERQDEAIDLYKTALASTPDSIPLLLRLAQLEDATGQVDQSIGRMNRVIELQPDVSNHKISLGRLYLKNGEPLKALDTVEGMLTLDPRNPDLLKLIGRAQMASQQLPEAIDTFERWAEVAPDSPDPFIHLGRVYEDQDNHFKAGQELTRALEIDPENVSARFFYARLLGKAGQFDQAEAELRKLRAEYPDNPQLDSLAGHLAYLQNRPVEAVEFYRKAFEKQPYNALLTQLARSERAIGEKVTANERMEQWVAEHPEDYVARFTLAEFYLVDKRLAEAAEQYRVITEGTPQNFAVRNNLAWVLAELGDLEAALVQAEEARVLAPNDPSVMDTLAVIYLKSGRTEEALELLRHAAQSADDPTVRFHLAQALVDSGDRTEAREILRTILAERRPFPERQEAETLLGELEG